MPTGNKLLITADHNSWNSTLRPVQYIVRLYGGSNLRWDEMKDYCPFRYTLAGYEPALTSGLRLNHSQRQSTKTRS